ncbi:SusC/RagA family TonB-linked outer membrane protein [Pelobium manganitolerans]|uniref:SusC/RagA family TonB-linked outer membrane protein n=1 Tax=Pelobium manganitolerans TaxID=1842495 RepID=A0A419S756_9SPHI|nr:TonB-dependent receptor [Pelobium manganitolerans]RKD17155.1 SusC/RagA family TonB-linked outer membrane protein [Pelobium manganitolerans]
MSKKILLLLFIWCTTNLIVFGQTKTITGTVTDKTSGETLVGVVVSVKGTSLATQTDINGKYSLAKVSDNATLQFKYLGYKTAEVPVNKRSEVNAKLEMDVSNLNEVVVIGYGTVARKDLTASVGSLKGTEIEKTPVSNIAEALTGRIPGVRVGTVDGAPGAEIVIRVRGGSSITQDNSPLYIVDGFIVDDISNIAPTDIESIDVLKDASSTAIYGARGGNGVIIVTTKSPKAGKTSISYNGYSQSKFLPKELDVLSPYEFVLAQYEYALLRGETSSDFKKFTQYFGVYDDLDLYKYQKGTNWQDKLFGQGTNSQQHSLSLTGGSEKTKLSFNSTYNKDEGLLATSGVERLYLNFKLNHDISKALRFDAGVRYTNNEIRGAGTSGSSSLRISDGVVTRPVNGIADNIVIDPTSAGDDDYDQFLKSLINPVDLAEQDYRKRIDKALNMNGALTWHVIKGLDLKSEIATSYNLRNNQRYYGPLTGESRNVGGNLPLGEITEGEGQTYRFTNTANYKFGIGKDHDFTALLGQEILSAFGNDAFRRAKYFDISVSPEVLFANMQLGTPDRSETSVYKGQNISSFFGRVNYSFKDRYLFAASLRADGSSLFAPGNKWGYFPAASAGWRVSEEDFMKDITFISELKLRASYGASGNNRIPRNSYLFTFEPSTNRPYGAGDIAQPYYVVANKSLPNPALQWETNVTNDIGVDFGLFKNKLTGTFDFYYNTTKGLLIGNAIPSSTGFTEQNVNLGKTRNRGVELSLNGNLINKKDFSLSATFNIGANRPKILKLDGNDSRPLQSNWAGTDLKTQDDYLFEVGKTIGLMYGYVSDGFYTADDFESYDPVKNTYTLKPGVVNSGNLGGGILGVRPGVMKFKDLSDDGTISADKDRQIIGNAIPKHTGGFGVNATYKGFDMSTFFNWSYGNDVYNTGRISFNMYYRSSYGNLLQRMNYADRYKYIDGDGALVTDLAALNELNKDAKVWSPFSSGSASPVFSSDAVEDGSYLRLTYVTLGYTLPKSFTSKFGVSKLRIYATGYNLFVLTNYSGYDPEVSSTRSSAYAQLTPGVDYSSYPKSRTFTFGVNLNF